MIVHDTGERFYVIGVSGQAIVTDRAYGMVGTSFSVIDRLDSHREVRRAYSTAHSRLGVKRRKSSIIAACNRLNAKHRAWLAAA